MMSEPLPSGWHSAAPSEARRSIPSSPPTSSAPLPVFLVPSLPPPLALAPLPSPPPLPRFISRFLSFASFRASGRCCAPQQEQTSPRGRHGATESRWMDLGAVSPIPWNYHGATVGVHPAGSASSAGYVLHANDHRASLSLSPSSPLFAPHLLSPDSIHVSIYSSLDKGFDRTITKFV